MRHIIRHAFVALSLTACSSAWSVTGFPPFTFTQGTPAKAAEVMANFQALADAIDAQKLLIDAQTLRMNAQDVTIAALTAVQPDKIVQLINRVDKLDGTTPVTMADLAGTYSMIEFSWDEYLAFRNSANPVITTKNTAIFNLDGTITLTGINTLTQGGAGSVGSITSTNNAGSLAWALSNGVLTFDDGLPLSIVSGGRLLIGITTYWNGLPGKDFYTKKLILFTRTN